MTNDDARVAAILNLYVDVKAECSALLLALVSTGLLTTKDLEQARKSVKTVMDLEREAYSNLDTLDVDAVHRKLDAAGEASVAAIEAIPSETLRN